MKHLPLPTSQIQEVLFELIKKSSINRKSMLNICGVWNLTARISNLRDKNVEITSNKIEAVNKYGRDISFVHYSLPNKKQAIEIYLKMVKDSE